MKTLRAIVIFGFGATFWLMNTPNTGHAPPFEPWFWVLTHVLVVLAFVGYIVTAWTVMRIRDWWSSTAMVSSMLGLLAVTAFFFAHRTVDSGFQDLGAQLNVWFHLLGILAVIVLARLPALRTWIAETA